MSRKCLAFRDSIAPSTKEGIPFLRRLYSALLLRFSYYYNLDPDEGSQFGSASCKPITDMPKPRVTLVSRGPQADNFAADNGVSALVPTRDSRLARQVPTSLSLKSEVEELVLEQIQVFKQSAPMDDPDIFEYRLRHNWIKVLYGQLDRLARATALGR